MKTHILVQPYMHSKGEDVVLPGSDPDRYETLLARTTEQMKLADDNGYAGFCMTEHHFQVEGIEITTNPLLWNLHIAANTKNLMVGQVGRCGADGASPDASGRRSGNDRPHVRWLCPR
ncbi:hypothetical protein [Ruegeria atlantica]|uniref:hypothetical protein n=1 Tax=Ruegeria atlantica TaxID=81569 RepID=UPI00147C769C|nr:hypothetical protein [Ruegeria atlantica]